MNRTIVSIWPMAQVQRRELQSPVKVFELPAAPFDGYVTLNVTTQSERVYLAGNIHANTEVPVDEITNDLAKAFSSFTCGGTGAVGVWVSEIDNPTDEQIRNSPQYAQARQLQDIIMQNIVKEARILHKEDAGRGICEKHHIAASYLNIEGEPWQTGRMTRAATQECPFCRSYVSSEAVVCSGCNNIIDPEGHVRLEQQIKNRIEAVRAQASMVPDNGGSALRPALAKPGQKKELASV